MKNIKFLLIIYFILSGFFLYSEELTNSSYNLYMEQSLSEFSQKGGYINLDSSIDFIGMEQKIYPAKELALENTVFSIFDYKSNTEDSLIAKESIKDIVFVKSEDEICINIKYEDLYGNEISAGYPKLYYKKNTEPNYHEMSYTSKNFNVFSFLLPVTEYGEYEYYAVATNGKYPDEYKSEHAIFRVTERPHSFKNLKENLQDNNGTAEINIEFCWSAQAGVTGDVLKYYLYIGTDPDNMTMYRPASNSYILPKLAPRTRYYWKVEVENQYGIQLLDPPVFCFITLGKIVKAYNAPNPFNPKKNEKTRIFFEMPADGSAEIDIYSEYGDKIWHYSVNNLLAGNNEVLYDGKDDYGNILYNGTYLCVIKKKYNGHTQTEKCRLLIIK